MDEGNAIVVRMTLNMSDTHREETTLAAREQLTCDQDGQLRHGRRRAVVERNDGVVCLLYKKRLSFLHHKSKLQDRESLHTSVLRWTRKVKWRLCSLRMLRSSRLVGLTSVANRRHPQIQDLWKLCHWRDGHGRRTSSLTPISHTNTYKLLLFFNNDVLFEAASVANHSYDCWDVALDRRMRAVCGGTAVLPWSRPSIAYLCQSRKVRLLLFEIAV